MFYNLSTKTNVFAYVRFVLIATDQLGKFENTQDFVSNSSDADKQVLLTILSEGTVFKNK